MKRRGLLFLIGAALCASVVQAQTVRTTWQQNAPFATYKTLSWRDPKSPGLPFYGQWIKPDVTTELNAKGLQEAPSGQAGDVVATYRIQGQEMIDADTTSDGFDVGVGPWGGPWGWYGGWGGWGGWEGDTTATAIHQNTRGKS